MAERKTTTNQTPPDAKPLDRTTVKPPARTDEPDAKVPKDTLPENPQPMDACTYRRAEDGTLRRVDHPTIVPDFAPPRQE